MSDMDRRDAVITEIVDGVYQLTMPLPFRLDHINLYLLEESDGWVLIDTGLNCDLSKRIWENLLNTFFADKPLKYLVLTHLHPDHIGMAAWLQKRCELKIFISEPDWRFAEQLWKVGEEDYRTVYSDYFRQFGVTGDLLTQLVEGRAGYKRLVKELPENVIFIRNKDFINIAHSYWQFVAAYGHSQEHMCLWNESRGLLISGDHLLPTITPNISIYPFGARNPLKSYLDSLTAFKRLNCTMYLPAHGPISSNYEQRIDHLIAHHHDNMEKLRSVLDKPMTVFDLVPVLFAKDLPAHQMSFALGEAAAHVKYMLEEGVLQIDNEWPATYCLVDSQSHSAELKTALDA